MSEKVNKKKAKFSLGEVLTVVHNNLLTTKNWGELAGILSCLVGVPVLHHEFGPALKMCQPHLTRQFPHLATPDVKREIDELHTSLEALVDRKAKVVIVDAWLTRLGAQYGSEFEVSPIEG